MSNIFLQKESWFWTGLKGHFVYFRDETSDKPKENRVVKFHDEAAPMQVDIKRLVVSQSVSVAQLVTCVINFYFLFILT